MKHLSNITHLTKAGGPTKTYCGKRLTSSIRYRVIVRQWPAFEPRILTTVSEWCAACALLSTEDRAQAQIELG